MADEVGVAQVKPLGNSTSLTLTYSAELIDRCIGSRIWIILKSKKEFTGVLLGFDDYVSTIPFPLSHCLMTGYRHAIPLPVSEQQDDGTYTTQKVGRLLLNSNTVCMYVPDGRGPLEK